MSYYFAHPLKDNGRDLSTYTYITYSGHDNGLSPNKVDISSIGNYSTDGNKVVSMTAGTVIDAGTFDSGIGYVVIKAESAAEPVTKVRYLHLDNRNLAVKAGDQVAKGQLIGYVAPYDENGRYGFGEGTGAHLHVDFGDDPNDESVNFEDFAPLPISKLPNDLNYDESIYQRLCSLSGVTSSLSSTYFWPYMLWAQKPVDIIQGNEIDLSGVTGQARIDVGYYTEYDTDWATSSNQRRIYDKWVSQGKPYDNHLAVLNGRYLVAVATEDSGGHIGHVGNEIDIVLKNNNVIRAIIADAKAVNIDPNATEWGHSSNTGLNIIEFEIENGSDPLNHTPEEWKSTVSKIIIGENILN